MYFNISLFQTIFQVVFGASMLHQDTTEMVRYVIQKLI